MLFTQFAAVLAAFVVEPESLDDVLVELLLLLLLESLELEDELVLGALELVSLLLLPPDLLEL